MSLVDAEKTVVSPFARMTPAIAAAVVAVMGQVGTLGKDGDNKHASYRYVSVDKFFDAVGRLMAKEGLFVITNEVATRVERVENTDAYGKSKTASWLSANYELFLCHSSGAICGPINREIRVLASGPQSYGAAASFVEKYFLRALFKIPTGDEDIDAHPTDALLTVPNREHPTPPPPPPSNGKRILPKSWREETEKLFREANTYDMLNAAHTKVLKVFNFDQMQLDEVEDMLMRESKKFFEEDQNA